MIILLTADPFIPVPPIHYGGIERVIHMLIDGYVANGHQVHLLAHKDSNHPLVSSLHAWPKENPVRTEHLQCIQTLRKVVRITEPDVIHSFCRLQYILGLRWSTKSFILQCYQREISVRTTGWAALIFPKNQLNFSACGAHMIESRWPHFDQWHVVHNCTDTDKLVQNEQVEVEHYVFLGRIEPIKGIEEAIQLAQRTHTPLRIAGNIEAEHRTFFETKVRPHIDGKTIQYIGTVDDAEKQLLFAGAKAFLMLIQWEEPFGIVMAEALSCGVPILALNRGSVPEIVKDGFNGFRADTVDELVKKAADLHTIDQANCRQDALTRFSISSISKQYLDILEKGGQSCLRLS